MRVQTRFQRAEIWIAAALLVALVQDGRTSRSISEAFSRRMSFENRLLLNRAAISGLPTLEVMLLVRDHAMPMVSALVAKLGGEIHRTDDEVRYLRVAVPTERLLALLQSSEIAAYQISSFSRANWYRDGPPRSNAEMYRGFEVSAPGARATDSPDASLPLLSLSDSRTSGYTADDDAGVGQWLEQHPTFDGRGVTIALLESGQPAFSNPILGSARTLDGRPVPKLAGIVNPLDQNEPDQTRVRLETTVRAKSAWARIDGRTYILPHSGAYRFGTLELAAGRNLAYRFGVLEDEATREIRVDANGNADFRDEQPMADVNERLDVRTLKLVYPRAMDLSFVIARGRAPHTMHIYLGISGHQTMTLSVAAGSRSPNSLAYGVAPNARVLLVRTIVPQYPLVDLVEGWLDASKRSDVDVFCESAGFMLVPDTAADFTGLLFRRISAVLGKPLFHAAGNMQLFLNSVYALGDGFSVGGSLGPRTYAALYGGGSLRRLMVHPFGAAGPSLDGAIKPDFLAPMYRLAADVPWGTALSLPANDPSVRLPAGYQISCCTSATSPYAAGVAALLISAAKQQRVPYSLASLGRALRIGARFLPDVSSVRQGSGVLDIARAWRELTHPVDVPRITASASIVHPLAQYAAQGSRGQGLYEFGNWTSGMTGRRDIRFRRESGADRSVTYRLSWTGNDGTFASPSVVTLPLDDWVAVPITVDVKSSGAHGALLNLHDPATDRIVFRTQATVVAADHADPRTGTIRMAGAVPLMGARNHYLHVPPDVQALNVDLDVIRGAVSAAILPSHTLYSSYYPHVNPVFTATLRPGPHHLVLPNPEPGTWTIALRHDAAFFESGHQAVPPGDAEYAITARLVRTSLQLDDDGRDGVRITLQNAGSELGEPILQATRGTERLHRASFLPSGLPNLIDINVPDGASILRLHVQAAEGTDSPLELYLYDCSTGECFSDSFAIPAANAHTMVVRKPAAGRWVAAVNAAPFPTAPGGFVLDEIVTTGSPRRVPGPVERRPPGSRWTQTLEIAANPSVDVDPGGVLLFELIDSAAERDQSEHPWDRRPYVPPLRDRPVAAGTAVYRVR